MKTMEFAHVRHRCYNRLLYFSRCNVQEEEAVLPAKNRGVTQLFVSIWTEMTTVTCVVSAMMLVGVTVIRTSVTEAELRIDCVVLMSTGVGWSGL